MTDQTSRFQIVRLEAESRLKTAKADLDRTVESLAAQVAITNRAGLASALRSYADRVQNLEAAIERATKDLETIAFLETGETPGRS